ncbi:MAG: AzlC family ABC transporter permease [Proteobacteria bacterium]|nr:AzlC family ABC transporter permease [Pseudomonadota bacterium]
MTAPRRLFIEGFRDLSPIFLGAAPFGIIAGISMTAAGMSPVETGSMTVIVLAGAAQLAAAELIGKGAPLLVVVLTALVINLRFTMYSASLAPHFKNLPLRWKLLCAYGLTDQAYAVAITRYTKEPELANKHWYYLGAAFALWACWQVTVWVGVLVGVGVPPEWKLEFAVPLTFLALLLPHLKTRPSLAAALTASLVAVLAVGLPYNLGLFLAAGCGVTAGSLLSKGQNA